MSGPAVTVIVPTWNRAPTLRITLESLRRQTFRDWTALVVGDHCTDGSADVVAWMDDPRIRWRNRDTNGGQSAWPVNDALAIADTPWIAYLTHDDLWFPWHLEALLTTAEATGADFVHGLALDFAHVPAQDRMAIVHVFAGPPPPVAYGFLPLPPCTWLHRRALVDELGPWADPDRIDTAPDQEFQRRAALAGKRFAFSPRLGTLYLPAAASGRDYRNERAPAGTALAGKLFADPDRLELDLLRKLAAGIAASPNLDRLALPERASRLIALPPDDLDRERATEVALAIGHGMARLSWPTWRERYAGRNTPDSVREFQEFRARGRRARGLDPDAAPAPAAPAPLAIRAVELDPAGDSHEHGRLALVVDGVSTEPVVLVDGIPAPAVPDADGRLLADLPAAIAPGTTVEMQALSGPSVSPPVRLVLRGAPASSPLHPPPA